MMNRFLLDYDNPDAGIGHSMGIINRAIKIAARNQLQFAYAEDQLSKSHNNSAKWKLKQWLRTLRGKKANETHNIGNDLNQMLNPRALLADRADVEKKIRRGEIKLIELPKFEIHIPSNEQNDDEIYAQVDQFIQSYPESNIAFKISNNRFGDYEYAASRNWFIEAYSKARLTQPLPLLFDSNKINIAVHIRRGDLLPGRQFSDLSSRMLPDSWYLKILEAATENTLNNIAIHIFSEGSNGQYHSEHGSPFSWKEHFKSRPFEVHEYIDSDFMGTFHHLLNADLLIGSKSGMSHLAGTLGNQIKIMPTMWHSYRGANRLLEVSSVQSELDKSQIATHIARYL